MLAAASFALLPFVSFDFDPLNLKDPKAESVITARDLMKDPMTTPYTAEILAPSLRQAEALADRLGTLPEVAQAITASSFVPTEQEPKLAILGDLRLLLGPTLTPDATLRRQATPRSPPRLTGCAGRRGRSSRATQARAHRRSGGPLSRTIPAHVAGPAIMPALERDLLSGIEQRLDMLRRIIDVQPVTIDGLPSQLRNSSIAPNETRPHRDSFLKRKHTTTRR